MSVTSVTDIKYCFYSMDCTINKIICYSAYEESNFTLIRSLVWCVLYDGVCGNVSYSLVVAFCSLHCTATHCKSDGVFTHSGTIVPL